MNRSIAIITGLHVLAHSVFGCCAHGVAAPSPVEAQCQCHHAIGLEADVDHVEHVPACGASEQHAPPCEHHQCVHAFCHWVAGDAAADVNLRDAMGSGLLMTILPPALTALPMADGLPSGSLAQAPALPLRLHLVVGVLLI